MKKLMIGMSLLVWVSSVVATEITGNPGNVNTLSFSNGAFTFLENYDSTDANTGWASKAYQYSRVDQDTYGAGVISFSVHQPTEDAAWVIYKFIIPADDATIGFSSLLREGAAVRVAMELDQLGDTSALLARGDHIDGWGFTACSGTVPSSQLNTSVAGQTSFFLEVLNEGNYQSAAGIDALTITAVPEPVTFVVMAVGALGFIRRHKRVQV